MEELNLENQNSLNTGDASDIDITDTDLEGGFTSNEVNDEQEVEKIKEQNKQLYARLKKLEAKLKEKKVESNQPEGRKGEDEDWKEKIEFLVKRRDLEADELEVISAFAKGLNTSLEEASKHPAVEGALKALREKKAAERASLEASSRQSSGGETSLLEKAKRGELSDEEFKKNFRKIQEEFFSKGNKSFE